MQLTVTVVLEDEQRPPAGSAVRVEVRDASFADAPAQVLCATDGHVMEPEPGEQRLLTSVTCEVDPWPDMGIVWVHVDVDGDGRVSVGDYITKELYPLTVRGDGTVMAKVRRV